MIIVECIYVSNNSEDNKETDMGRNENDLVIKRRKNAGRTTERGTEKEIDQGRKIREERRIQEREDGRRKS